MEPEDNAIDIPQSAQGVRGCYRANLVLNAFVALGLGLVIILILNIFNRNGGFALLSGLFGALLYCAIAFPRILFGRSLDPARRHRGARNNAAEQQGDRRATQRMAFGGMAIACILTAAAGFGLYYLPANDPIFALMDAVLALVICAALFIMVLSLLVLFGGRGHTEGNNVYFDF